MTHTHCGHQYDMASTTWQGRASTMWQYIVAAPSVISLSPNETHTHTGVV